MRIVNCSRRINGSLLPSVRRLVRSRDVAADVNRRRMTATQSMSLRSGSNASCVSEP